MNTTDICNMALSSIGQGRIASLTEDSELARQCAIYYDLLRKSLLDTFRWGFAERSKKLAEVNAEMPGWDHVYAVPNDCRIVRQIYNRNERLETSEFTKEHTYHQFKISLVDESTKVVMVNMEDAWMDYTADIRNAEMFNPHFCEALAHKLAYYLAMPLSGSQSIKQTEYQLYQTTIQQAMLASAIENHHKIQWSQKYFDARR